MSTHNYQIDTFDASAFCWTDESHWLVAVFGKAPEFPRRRVRHFIDVAEICDAYREFGEVPEVVEYVGLATALLGNVTTVCLTFRPSDHSAQLLNALRAEVAECDAGLLVLT